MTYPCIHYVYKYKDIGPIRYTGSSSSKQQGERNKRYNNLWYICDVPYVLYVVYMWLLEGNIASNRKHPYLIFNCFVFIYLKIYMFHRMQRSIQIYNTNHDIVNWWLIICFTWCVCVFACIQKVAQVANNIVSEF